MSRHDGWSLSADPALYFQSGELSKLKAIWETKAAAAKGLPAREDFDPETLRPFLRHVSIVERAMHPAGHTSFCYRFYGSALMQRFGEQTGQFIEMSIPPDRVSRWIKAYETVLDAGKPMRFLASFEIPRVSYLNGESFVAPLSNAGRKPVAVLACTFFTPRIELAAQSA